ncbi:MAG: membrane protein insertion efficiency factor YidD [Desulfobacterales bacterium]|nr:MAG: membrane protein insertion efficiency factor YidD [Desulfobacterales bacterium]
MTRIDYRTVIVILLLFLLNGNAFAGQKQKIEKNLTTTEPDAVLVLPIQLYQKYLSKVDGNRCPMEPSCSTFCVTAIKKHGFLLGWIMCSDRLTRCGRDEEKISIPIWINNKKRIYDPVHHNDFWW